MKKLIAPLFLCVIAHMAMAQKIEMYKKFGGVDFMRGDTLLSERQVSMILFKDNKTAYNELKKAKKFNTFSSILGFAGGALIAIIFAVRRHYRCPKCGEVPMGTWVDSGPSSFGVNRGVDLFPANCPHCGARLR